MQPTQRYLAKYPYAKSGAHGSFARVWGYRSVLQIIPSTLIDGVLILLLVVLFRPVAWLCVFAELLLRSLWLALWAAVMAPIAAGAAWLEATGGVTLPALRRIRGGALASRRTLRRTLRCACSPTLLVRAIPGVGIWLSGKAYGLRRRVSTLSVVFRVCVHFL